LHHITGELFREEISERGHSPPTEDGLIIVGPPFTEDFVPASFAASRRTCTAARGDSADEGWWLSGDADAETDRLAFVMSSVAANSGDER